MVGRIRRAGKRDSLAIGRLVAAVVLRREDVEDKLVVSDRTGWTSDEITAAVRFQERFFDSTVVCATDL